MDLTDTQRDILGAMPATLNAIADDLGMTKSGVEYHVHERLRPAGYRLDRKSVV